MLTLKQKLKLCSFALGIFGCYTVFGLLQEKIFRGRYGEEIDEVDGKLGERYRLPLTFGLMQDVFYATCAKGLIIATNQPKNESSQVLFALAALFHLLGKFTSNLSLQWIPYTTQIVGKALSPIPVMLLGVLIAGKRYTMRKVIFVVTIVFGVCLFIYKKKYEEQDGENPLIGNALVGMSVLFEGLCGATEDRMRVKSKPTPLNLIFYLFTWSASYHTIGILLTGEMPKFIDFVSRHPEIIKFFVGIVCAGFAGQMFITSMLMGFGALPFSITATTRKFFSVILSVIIYQNSLSLRQWLASALIFGCLLIDGVMSKKSPSENLKSDEKETEGEEMIEQKSNLIGLEKEKKVEILIKK